MSCPEDRLWREEYRKLLGDDSDDHHAINDDYYRQNGIVPSGVKLPRFFYRNETEMEEEDDPNVTKSDDMWTESELKDCLQKCRPILLDKIEKQLYRGEELYFQETDGYGNIFRGWMDTLDTTKVPDNLATMDNNNSHKRMPLDYRWFSTQTRPTKTTRSTSSSSNITSSGIATNHHPNTSSWKQSSFSNIATPNTRTGTKVEQPALKRSFSLPKNIKATNKEDTIKVEQKKKKKTSTTSSNHHVREPKSNQDASKDKSSIVKKSVSTSSLKRTNSTGNISSASNRKSLKRLSTTSSNTSNHIIDDNDTTSISKGKKETSTSTESTDSKSRSATQQETSTATNTNNSSPKNQLEFTIPRKKKQTTSLSQQSSESTNPSIVENIPRKIRPPSNSTTNHSNNNSNQKSKTRKRKSIESSSTES